MQLCSGGLLTLGHRWPHRLLRGLALQPRGASLKATQVVVQRLDVSEDAHGVWLAAHHHHVLHLNEALTVGQIPETQKPHQNAGPSHQPASLPPEQSLAWSWRLPSAPQLGTHITPEEPLRLLSLMQCFPDSHIQEPPLRLVFLHN